MQVQIQRFRLADNAISERGLCLVHKLCDGSVK